MKKLNSRTKVIGLLIGVGILATVLIVGSILRESPNVQTELLPIIGNEEVYEILNDRSGEGFFVYVGRDTCPACLFYEPILRELLRDLGRTLRYFELDRILVEHTEAERMLEILQLLGAVNVPSIVYIQNGEVSLLCGEDIFVIGVDPREVTLEFFNEHGGLN